jgi:hypothetical protein
MTVSCAFVDDLLAHTHGIVCRAELSRGNHPRMVPQQATGNVLVWSARLAVLLDSRARTLALVCVGLMVSPIIQPQRWQPLSVSVPSLEPAAAPAPAPLSSLEPAPAPAPGPEAEDTSNPLQSLNVDTRKMLTTMSTF